MKTSEFIQIDSGNALTDSWKRTQTQLVYESDITSWTRSHSVYLCQTQLKFLAYLPSYCTQSFSHVTFNSDWEFTAQLKYKKSSCIRPVDLDASQTTVISKICPQPSKLPRAVSDLTMIKPWKCKTQNLHPFP